MAGTAGVQEQNSRSFVLFGELRALQNGGSAECGVEAERDGARGVTGTRAEVLNAMIMSLDCILNAGGSH